MSKRRVDSTEWEGYQVSTVFLGINHNFGEGVPLLFETMIFTNSRDEVATFRYTTWEDAEEGHSIALRYLKEGRFTQ
jgi:hypothetical protein